MPWAAGSLLIPDTLAGLEVRRPEHFAVANAVGAAIGQVSGEVDRVFGLGSMTRDEALAEARREATMRAIAAGADADTIELVDQEDVPLAYLPGNATRVRTEGRRQLEATHERAERVVRAGRWGVDMSGVDGAASNSPTSTRSRSGPRSSAPAGGGNPYIGKLRCREELQARALRSS